MEIVEKGTPSHALAAETAINTRAAKNGDGGSLRDLGWNERHDENREPWIEGLHNEDVWVLLRRMDKVVFEVSRTDRVADGELDMAVSETLECSPNKLRSEVERLYMGVMLGLLSFAKTVTRLRSWHEPRRTGMFCVAYFTAWYVDCLLFAGICMLLGLTTSVQVRHFLFPPAPLSMINTKDGAAAKPMAGMLGSTDTATGAPQNLRGESAENEASNFVTSFAAIAANLLTGQDPHGAPYDAPAGSSGGTTPHVNAGTMAVAKDKAEGMDRPSEDKTKTPMEQAIWAHTTPMLHRMISISNTWERFANMLVPTPPFDREEHQKRLALYILPAALLSLVISRDLAIRTLTFLFGVMIFGRPLLSWAGAELSNSDWAVLMEPFGLLFKGVPTNLQLALTLLRVGEANRAPLPPAIGVHKIPPDEAIDLDEVVLDGSLGDKPLGLSKEDLHQLAEHNQDMVDDAGGADNEMEQAAGHNHKREKVFGVLKDGARGAVKAVVAVDKLRGKAGAPHAKLRAGVLPSSHDQPRKLGPIEFSGRYHGTKGYVHVNSTDGVPYVSFNKRSMDKTKDEGDDGEKGPRMLWSINIDDITQLKKHSGYGLKTKLGTGWAVNGGVQDGLRIGDAQGNQRVVTALPHRDALFNRLCAIGRTTKWEIC